MSAATHPLQLRLAALRTKKGTDDAPLDTDALLEAFLDEQRTGGVELYPAQEEAVLELASDHHVVLGTPTG